MKLLREERDRRIATSDWRVTKAKETSTQQESIQYPPVQHRRLQIPFEQVDSISSHRTVPTRQCCTACPNHADIVKLIPRAPDNGRVQRRCGEIKKKERRGNEILG